MLRLRELHYLSRNLILHVTLHDETDFTTQAKFIDGFMYMKRIFHFPIVAWTLMEYNAYNRVRSHFVNEDNDCLFMFVHGLIGHIVF